MTDHDVVVVGAGSAGAALAGRLSEDPSLRVLLLEAGGSDKVLEVQIPAALYKVWRTRRDWNYATDEQPGLGGRRLFWPRGKVLGGSSSINAMIYIRGARADYDEWARLTGDDSWSYDSVLPLFRRMEDNARGADEWHGVGGPLRVEDLRSPHPWTTAVAEPAAKESRTDSGPWTASKSSPGVSATPASSSRAADCSLESTSSSQ